MRESALHGHVTATSVADALVEAGVPFRAAHHVVGRLVAEADRRGCRLDELDDAAFATALSSTEDSRGLAADMSNGFGARLRVAATLEAAIARPRVIGGTAPERVRAAVLAARRRLEDEHSAGSAVAAEPSRG
jgi:argininosuccinate lyase